MIKVLIKINASEIALARFCSFLTNQLTLLAFLLNRVYLLSQHLADRVTQRSDVIKGAFNNYVEYFHTLSVNKKGHLLTPPPPPPLILSTQLLNAPLGKTAHLFREQSARLEMLPELAPYVQLIEQPNEPVQAEFQVLAWAILTVI